MTLPDRLERRFGRFGIPNLITYVVAGRAIAFVLTLGNPAYRAFLVLDPWAVRHGEVWRLATWIFTPPELLSGIFGGWLGVIIQMYFTWLVGRALEAAWGAFRFTLYYGLGALGTAAAALVVMPLAATPDFLDLSLFLAFATVFPEMPILLFLIIPVKVKWLGWISAAGLAWSFLREGAAGRITILVAFSNYLVFFWPVIAGWARGRRHPVAQADTAPPPVPAAVLAHRCTQCGRTEKDEPNPGFRWCTCEKCGPDGKEWCVEHLQTHLGDHHAS
jgi:hypothetical protein